MPDTNENLNIPPNTNLETPSGGLLGEILQSGAGEKIPPIPHVDLLSDDFIVDIPTENTEVSPSTVVPEPIKKVPKKSMNTTTFLRMVGAILLVAFIFFGAFLAYIVFNPGQATFFISFGINP